MATSGPSIQVSALYRFVSWPNHSHWQQAIQQRMHAFGIKGTLLLAKEGINGTVAAAPQAMTDFLTWLRRVPELDGLRTRDTRADAQPFLRAKVKLKREIVTMGVPDLDPAQSAGHYVPPKDWNALISDPSVTVIDTRNRYEVAIGSFKEALNPQTQSFREFPNYVSRHLDPRRHKRVAMFCTGGIRCEKSTSYLKSVGFDEVYHLKGGILGYLAETDPNDSLWQGDCFVFDGRVAVNHQLQPSDYQQCHACRHPLTPTDRQSPDYREGISCSYCCSRIALSRRQRFEERQKQVQLSQTRGEAHLGSDSQQYFKRRQQAKLLVKERQRQHQCVPRQGLSDEAV